MPDFSQAPDYGALTTLERSGLSPATDTGFFPQDQPERTFAFSFTLMTAAEILVVKRFFRAQGGRLAPFYLPSWRQDLPPVSGAQGANMLTVIAPGYSIGDHADDRGRQIFIWQPGEALFVSSVIAATEGAHGHVELNLSRFLPFAVDAGSAVIGYAYVARFADDDLNWTHLTAGIGITNIRFQSIRQWIGEAETSTIDHLTHAPVLAFDSCAAVVEESDPPDNRVAYAFGPATLHTGESPPFATGYVAWVNGDGIRLATASAPPPFSQSVPDPSGALTTLVAGFVDTEHLTLAFEANGFEILALQHDPATVRIYRKLFGGPTHYDFAGLDPLIMQTANMDPTIESEDSDAVCFYRKPDDNRLYTRFLSEFVATERVAAVLPFRPAKLKRAWMDGRYLKIAFLDASMRHVTLTSLQYPAP